MFYETGKDEWAFFTHYVNQLNSVVGDNNTNDGVNVDYAGQGFFYGLFMDVALLHAKAAST